MYTLSFEEKILTVGGKPSLLPIEVAEALNKNASAVLVAFGEAMHSSVSCLAVSFCDGSLQFARHDEPQWDGRYVRYTVRNDDIAGWSIYDHAFGRCYNNRDLGNLPEFFRGRVPAQPGDSPEVLELAKGIKPFVSKRERRMAAKTADAQTVYLNLDELDAALAARH